MKSIKNKIPELLVYSRLIMAWIMVFIALMKTENASMIISILLFTGLLTDVFDGIIARYLKVSTMHLRQMDTQIDRVFWLSALFSLMMLHPDFFLDHILQISIVLFLELAVWLIGRIKFRNNISFHAILSKFWAITLLITFIDALPDGQAAVSFAVTFWYGLIAQLDVMLIIFILPKFQCDIPSAWHAFRIRKGKSIRRMKLFNG